MSTRQLRKMQMLDAAAAAAEDGGSSSSDDALPETVRPKQRRKRTHKKVFEDASAVADEDVASGDDGAAAASPTESAASAKRKGAAPKANAPAKAPAKQQDKKKANSSGGASGGSKAGRSRTAKKIDDDDDDGAKDGGDGVPSVADLFVADRDMLDPRTERMRSFGAASVESLKPKYPQCPRFKPCALGTPDPNTWPPFDPLGLRLTPVDAAKTKGTSLAGTTLYNVDSSDSRFQAGSRALHAAAASGDIQVLADVWHRFPYHLPTLVQLHRTFATMGDVGEAQRCLDMALYTAGTVLSPLLGKPGTAAMLLASPGATLLLETLKLGVHNALRKGCARTALEVLKATFAADPQDSQRLLAIGDYVAIRGSAWAWLATVAHAARGSAELPISGMPTWAFNAALACRMLVDAAAAAAAAAAVGGSRKKAQGAAAKLPPAVAEAAGEGGCAMLRSAVLRFPSAAVAIADRAGHKLDGHPWAAFNDGAGAALTRGVVESRAMRHVTGIGAERCAELWKMPNATAFMSEAVAAIVADFAASPTAVLEEQKRELARFPPAEALDAVLLPYMAVTPDEAMGNFTGPAIPRELLEAGPTEEEMRRDNDARAMAHMDDDQRLMLERFEAALGALPADVPADQRARIYEDMLADRMHELGRDENAVTLFLRTLLPWNTPRQMALQRALQQAGREDPALTRRREARRQAELNDVEFVTYSSDDEGAADRDP